MTSERSASAKVMDGFAESMTARPREADAPQGTNRGDMATGEAEPCLRTKIEPSAQPGLGCVDVELQIVRSDRDGIGAMASRGDTRGSGAVAFADVRGVGIMTSSSSESS